MALHGPREPMPVTIEERLIQMQPSRESRDLLFRRARFGQVCCRSPWKQVHEGECEECHSHDHRDRLKDSPRDEAQLQLRSNAEL